VIEHFVYSTSSDPPQIEDISRFAQIAAWDVRVLRDWRDWSTFDLVNDGPLLSDDVTIGWWHKSQLARPVEIDKAVSNKEKDRIEELLRLFELGSATWIVDHPFDIVRHLEFDGLDDAAEQMGDLYANHVAESETKCTIIYCDNFQFLRLIAGVVAQLTGGMIEDPQSAAFAFPPQNPAMLEEMSGFGLAEWSTFGRPT